MTLPTLDYTIKDIDERLNIVNDIVEKATAQKIQLKPTYLEKLANYLIFDPNKKRRKKLNIITPNRNITINEREVSFEGCSEKYERNKDAIYNHININRKLYLTTPLNKISEEDMKTIPGMKELAAAIETIEKQFNEARLSNSTIKRSLFVQLKDMRKQQYILRQHYKKPIHLMNVTNSFTSIAFDDAIYIDECGDPINCGTLSFFEPKHILHLLKNYAKFKEDTYSNFESDGYYIIKDLETLIDTTLKVEKPIYFKILIYKIDGIDAERISQLIQEEFGKTYVYTYISKIWNHKIPNYLAAAARKQYILWYYTNFKPRSFKTCTKCKERKPKHKYFFTKNNRTVDKLHKVCKDCRRAPLDGRKK